MRKPLRTMALVLLVVLTTVCAPAAEQPVAPAATQEYNTQADTAAINRLYEDWIAAYHADDLAGQMAPFSDDAILMPAHEPIRIGKEAIRERTETGYEGFAADDVAITRHEIEVAGDLAFVRQTFTANWVPRDGGDPEPEDSKEIVILKRQPDGSWKISHYIWNSSDPLPQ